MFARLRSLPGRVPRAALLLLAVALTLRVGFVAATPDYTPLHDDRGYDRLACALVAGEGYTRSGPPATREGCGRSPEPGRPTAFRPPSYPMFLAAVYTVTEPLGIDRWTAARLAQALLGTIVVGLLGLIAYQLWGRRAAIAALGIGAVFAPAIVIGGSLLSETLFVALMLAAIAALLASRAAGGDRRWLVAAGVAAGLAVLTRSNAPVLLVPLAIGAASGAGAARARIARVAVVLGVAALVVAPWTVRNALAFDEFIPVSTVSGSSLAGTYSDTPRNDPRWPGAWKPPSTFPELRQVVRRVRRDEPESQRVLTQHAREYILDNPGYAVSVAARNAWRMTGLEGRDWWRFSGRSHSLPEWTADAAWIGFLIVLPLAVAGAFTREARRAPLWFWLLPALMFVSVIFVVGETRLRAPVDAFVVLLAAIAVSYALTGWRASPVSATDTPGRPRRAFLRSRSRSSR